MPSYRLLVALSIFALLACTERRATPSATQSPPGALEASARPYDRTTNETIRGQVVRVEHMVPTRRASNGVHVTVRVESGDTIAVHLGPGWFLEEHGLEVRTGDTLVVAGSRVMIDGAPALIARTVTIGARELVLRDEAGVPRWSARRIGDSGQATAEAIPLPRRTDMSALAETEKQALRDALEDEYRSWATYDQVIQDFGPVRPFINIRDAEARHIAALRALFERYGLAIPANTWPGRVPRSASTREACEAAIDAEIANAALYDRLGRSTNRTDVLAVFENLKSASQDRHLPAFRRCASRGGGRQG